LPLLRILEKTQWLREHKKSRGLLFRPRLGDSQEAHSSVVAEGEVVVEEDGVIDAAIVEIVAAVEIVALVVEADATEVVEAIEAEAIEIVALVVVPEEVVVAVVVAVASHGGSSESHQQHCHTGYRENQLDAPHDATSFSSQPSLGCSYGD
jgi:hypothetical protein